MTDYNSRKKLLLIINPIAGRMQGRKSAGDLAGFFCNHGFDVNVFFTAARGDASELCRQCAGRFNIIVCCGGDGTLNEVISGVMTCEDISHEDPEYIDNKEIPASPLIGYIPCGTTNDLAKSLGLPRAIMESAKYIARCNAVYHDVGLFNGDKHFSYVASFGAFTKASYSTPQNAKNTFGHIAYLMEGIKSIYDIKPIPLEIECEEFSKKGEYIFGAVTNSTSVGGVVRLPAGDISFNDGVFEVMLVKAPKNSNETARIFNEVISRKYDSELISFFKTKRITFISPAELEWTIDGEDGGKGAVTAIENLHNAVRLILP